MRIMEKDPCRGVVYLIALCDHPSLVSVLFAVLLSLHLVTFKMFFITCSYWKLDMLHVYSIHHSPQKLLSKWCHQDTSNHLTSCGWRPGKEATQQ